MIATTHYPATSNATDESVLTAHVRSWFGKPAGAKTKLSLRLGDPTTIKQKRREEEKMKERRVCDSSAASDACRHTVVSFKRLDVDSWLLSMAVQVLSWFTCSLTSQEKRRLFSNSHFFLAEEQHWCSKICKQETFKPGDWCDDWATLSDNLEKK